MIIQSSFDNSTNGIATVDATVFPLGVLKE